MTDKFDMQDEDVQMPLGLGKGEGENSQEITFGDEKKSKVSPATLALLGVFAAGMLAIYFVGMQTKPRAASAEESSHIAQVDSAIADMVSKSKSLKPGEKVSNIFKDTDRLVAMFYNYPGGDENAVELEHNPFAAGSPAVTASEPIVRAVNGNAAEQEKLRKVAENFSTLRLDTIMMSQNMKAAMINHKLVTVGAKVGEFTVLEIENQRVILGYENSKFELKVQRKGMDTGS